MWDRADQGFGLVFHEKIAPSGHCLIVPGPFPSNEEPETAFILKIPH